MKGEAGFVPGDCQYLFTRHSSPFTSSLGLDQGMIA